MKNITFSSVIYGNYSLSPGDIQTILLAIEWYNVELPCHLWREPWQGFNQTLVTHFAREEGNEVSWIVVGLASLLQEVHQCAKNQCKEALNLMRVVANQAKWKSRLGSTPGMPNWSQWRGSHGLCGDWFWFGLPRWGHIVFHREYTNMAQKDIALKESSTAISRIVITFSATCSKDSWITAPSLLPTAFTLAPDCNR